MGNRPRLLGDHMQIKQPDITALADALSTRMLKEFEYSFIEQFRNEEEYNQLEDMDDLVELEVKALRLFINKLKAKIITHYE